MTLGLKRLYNIRMEQAFLQHQGPLVSMCVELSELQGAGWTVSLIPRGNAVLMGSASDLVFRRANVEERPHFGVRIFTVNRYALALTLPEAVHQMYLMEFPISRDGLTGAA